MSTDKLNKSLWTPGAGPDNLTDFVNGGYTEGGGKAPRYKDTTTSFSEAIDIISRLSGLGSLSDAYQQMLKGINHRGLGNPIRTNRDNSGIVLFTRPDCNLTYDNIALCRLMTPLLTDNEYTLQRYIRA